MPERRVFGRLTHFEILGDGRRSRTSFEFDSIDANVPPESYERVIDDPAEVAPFALLRILTTVGRFVSMVGLEPQIGAWYELELVPRKKGVSGPIAFFAQLSELGFDSLARGTLRNIGFVLGGEPDDSVPPRSLSAGVAPAVEAVRQLAESCKFPINAIATRQSILAAISPGARVPAKLCIHDVGQASFATIYDRHKRPLLHFDVGWPTPFNGRTAPSKFDVPITNVPVIISHWDFDHIHGYWRFPHLRLSKWIAPVQMLSPNSRKILSALSASNNILGWTGPAATIGPYRLKKCTGNVAQANHSGIAIAVRLESEKSVLLVGDAHYDNIGFSYEKWDNLIVTHHGAIFNGLVPLPTERHRKAFVSVGRGNVYKHPKEAALLKHKSRGWTVLMTSKGEGWRRSSLWL